MTGRTSKLKKPGAPARKPRSAQYALLGAVCALVIGLYAWSARSVRVDWGGLNVENTYYNLLVQGFRAGQLNLIREAPSDLAHLSVSHDQAANSTDWLVENQLLDLSYYKGKLYLYFGVTPALMLFWPYVAVTGHYLLDQDAAVFFFSAGFLASVCLLWMVWRRHFAEVSAGVVVAGALALGLTNFTFICLQRCVVYEVPISCGYALTMVTLALVSQAMHARTGRAWWLAAASLAYGLALGARPSLLLGAVILLVPVAMAWRETAVTGQRREWWTLLLAATGPITVIGLGLLFYNFLRFDDPLEFGQRYQLPATWHQQFSLRYLWFNFRLAFLQPARWGSRFPFVHDIAVPPLPKGVYVEQLPFGALTNIPVVWLALAAPLAWRSRLAEARSILRWLLAAVALLFGTCAVTLCLHDSMCLRYEVEFLPMLVLLAVMGILGLERALADRLRWRLATRWGWGLLLAFSVSFNLFAMFERSSQSYVDRAISSFQEGQIAKAIAQYQNALKFRPDNAEAHTRLGLALFGQGRTPEGIRHLEEALQLKPDYAEAHNNLGNALYQLGRVPEAIGHWEQALRLRPNVAEPHHNLAVALFQLGRVPEAIEHLKEALRLQPDFAEARNKLGNALLQQSRVAEAIGHLEEALRLKPEYAEARNNLGVALFQLGNGFAAQGKWDEAIQQYQRAVEMKTDSAQAHESLGAALSRRGRIAEAVAHYRKALALDPQSASALNHLAWLLATQTNAAIRNLDEAVRCAERACELTTNSQAIYLDTLGVACSEAGRFAQAIQASERGAALARAAGNTELAALIESRLKHYREGRPYHAIPQGAGP